VRVFLCSKFPNLSGAEVGQVIFVGTQIKKFYVREEFRKEIEFRLIVCVEILQIFASLSSGQQKRGKLPRYHTTSATELPKVRM
jgi:hypothetical protein